MVENKHELHGRNVDHPLLANYATPVAAKMYNATCRGRSKTHWRTKRNKKWFQWWNRNKKWKKYTALFRFFSDVFCRKYQKSTMIQYSVVNVMKRDNFARTCENQYEHTWIISFHKTVSTRGPTRKQVDDDVRLSCPEKPNPNRKTVESEMYDETVSQNKPNTNTPITVPRSRFQEHIIVNSNFHSLAFSCSNPSCFRSWTTKFGVKQLPTNTFNTRCENRQSTDKVPRFFPQQGFGTLKNGQRQKKQKKTAKFQSEHSEFSGSWNQNLR